MGFEVKTTNMLHEQIKQLKDGLADDIAEKVLNKLNVGSTPSQKKQQPPPQQPEQQPPPQQPEQQGPPKKAERVVPGEFLRKRKEKLERWEKEREQREREYREHDEAEHKRKDAELAARRATREESKKAAEEERKKKQLGHRTMT